MKRNIHIFVAVIILLLVGVVPGYAGGNVRIGIGIGIGPVWPWWGPSYYPNYSAPVVIQQQAPVYEQQVPQEEAQQYYWYFCPESNTYYPYVKQCPSGWMKVVPTPPKGKE